MKARREKAPIWGRRHEHGPSLPLRRCKNRPDEALLWKRPLSVKLIEAFVRHLRESKKKLETFRLASIEVRKAEYDPSFLLAPCIMVGEVN